MSSTRAVTARTPGAEELLGWLRDWAPVDLVLDEPDSLLAVASPVLRHALAEALATLGGTGVELSVQYGDHRFDLTDRLDRALWRLLSARWAPAS